MGANLVTYNFKDVTETSLREKWRSAYNESLYEDGHSYSGNIGMLGDGDIDFRNYDPPFKSIEEAEEYISDNHDKWENALAVMYKDGKQVRWLVGGWCAS